MYKSFEKGGKYENMGITRVGCGSYVRRPFWKLKLTEEDARWITEKMDSIFVKEDSYKGLPDEERKRRRGEEVAPILHEIKQRLDMLKGEKSARHGLQRHTLLAENAGASYMPKGINTEAGACREKRSIVIFSYSLRLEIRQKSILNVG